MGFVGEPRGRLRICSVNSAKQAMRYLLSAIASAVPAELASLNAGACAHERTFTLP
jgi:hypothetical protein